MKSNPDLCPTHNVRMRFITGFCKISARICPKCKSEMHIRIMFIKYKIVKLKRSHWLAMHPNAAGLFEGL